MSDKIKKWLLFGSLLIAFLGFELLYYIIADIINLDLSTLSFNATMFLNILKYVFFTVLLIIIYHKYLVEKWYDFKSNFSKYFDFSLKYWLTGLVIMYISNIIITMFTNDIGQNEQNVQNIINNSPLIALSMTTIFAPFIEEMIFRKSLQDCFTNKTLFIIISGFIFGYLHIMGLNELILIIPYGSLGIAFAYILSKTNNIYCTILMHMLHNGLATILSMVI